MAVIFSLLPPIMTGIHPRDTSVSFHDNQNNIKTPAKRENIDRKLCETLTVTAFCKTVYKKLFSEKNENYTQSLARREIKSPVLDSSKNAIS